MYPLFTNRKDAGIKLASRLMKYKEDTGVVLAIPRGGVPVATEIARALSFPMDIVLARKIGHPNNKEYAIGAASLNEFFIKDRDDISEKYISDELEIIRATLKNMDEKFTGYRNKISIKSKTIIIVDDGIATGNTILATIRLLRFSQPDKIIVAVPVATKSAVKMLSKETDDVVVLHTADEFDSVGSFYEEFNQVSDEEVQRLLKSVSTEESTL